MSAQGYKLRRLTADALTDLKSKAAQLLPFAAGLWLPVCCAAAHDAGGACQPGEAASAGCFTA